MVLKDGHKIIKFQAPESEILEWREFAKTHCLSLNSLAVIAIREYYKSRMALDRLTDLAVIGNRLMAADEKNQTPENIKMLNDLETVLRITSEIN